MIYRAELLLKINQELIYFAMKTWALSNNMNVMMIISRLVLNINMQLKKLN